MDASEKKIYNIHINPTNIRLSWKEFLHDHFHWTKADV